MDKGFEQLQPALQVGEELIDEPGGDQDHDELQRIPFFDKADGDQQAEEEHDPEDDRPRLRLLAEDDAENDEQQNEEPVFLIDDGKQRQRDHGIAAGQS